MAALLTRYNNLVSLAAAPPADGATKEVAAANAFRMEVESNALVCPISSSSSASVNSATQVQAAEDLLQLTRELKELWLAGPLRKIGEGENDDKMAEDSKKVRDMVEDILNKASKVTGSGVAPTDS